MKIKKIVIEWLPGISRRFELVDLKDGINLIIGPNGSGKSSIRRLIENIFWPHGKRNNSHLKTSAEVAIQDGQNHLTAKIFNGSISWQKDGSPSPSYPSLPDSHLKGCFSLDLKDLIRETRLDGNDAVIQEIQKELSGFDFENIKQQFKVGPREGKEDANAVLKLEQRLREIEKKYNELSEEEKRIELLKTQLREAQKADTDIKTLQAILDAMNARTKIAEITEKLNNFPSAMDKLRKGDDKLLKDFDEKIVEANDTIEQLNDDINKYEKIIKNLSIPAIPPSDEIIDAKLKAADDLVRQTKQVERTKNKATEEKESLLAAAIGMPEPPVTIFEENVIPVIATLAERYEVAVMSMKEAETSLDFLTSQMNEPECNLEEKRKYADLLREKSDILREWLALPLIIENSETSTAKIPVVITAAGIAFILLGTGLAFISSWLLLIAGLGIGVIIGSCLIHAIYRTHITKMINKNGTESIKQEKYILERKYAELAENNEAINWKRSAVLECLKTIDDKAAFARSEAESIFIQLERMKETSRLYEKRKKELSDIKEKLSIELSEIGFSMSATALETKILVERLEKVSDAIIASAAATKDFESESVSFDAIKKELLSFLESQNRPVPENPREILAEIKRLEREITTCKDAKTVLEEKRLLFEKIKEKKNEIEKKRLQWLNDLLLQKESPEIELAARLELLDKYHSLKESERDAESAERVAVAKLNDVAKKRLEHTASSDIKIEIKEKEFSASNREAISEELGKIRQKVDNVAKLAEREQVSADLELSREKLNDTCDELLRKSAAAFLLSEIEEKYRKNNQPEVVSKASAYFNKFTRGLYELRLATGNNDNAFVSWHTSEEKYYQINELSDGTRIQLLLAVKMAFADQIDSNYSLPLILDEPLTTSDPVRFQAVAKALITISEKRQILHLSSDPSDVAKWIAASDDDEKERPKLFDLAKIRFSATDFITAKDELISLPEYPSPEQASPETYAEQLKVPKINIFDSVSSWHIFHATWPDTLLCHQLLSLYRIETIGQWRTVSHTKNGGESVKKRVGFHESAVIDANITLLSSLQKSLSAGKGKRFTAQNIAECPTRIISDNYKAKFADLAEELHGNAEQVLEAVRSSASDERTKGFRKKDELAEYLEENGFIDLNNPLTEPEIIASAERDCMNMIESGLISNSNICSTLDRIRKILL